MPILFCFWNCMCQDNKQKFTTLFKKCTTYDKSIVFAKYIVSNLFDFGWIIARSTYLFIVLYISSFSFLKSLSISWYYFWILSFEILPVTAYSLDWKNHIVNLMWHSGQYNLSRFYRLSPSQTGLMWDSITWSLAFFSKKAH